MFNPTRIATAACALALSLSAAPAGAAEPAREARALMIDGAGSQVAEVSLIPLAQGTRILLVGTGLPPGAHAFHVHQTGKCDPATGFKSAGGHFNPSGAEHGWANAKGHHAGDLPNVHVARDGTVEVEFFSAALRLDTGAQGLFDSDGAAMVMHSGADDYATDPAGAAGERIACGVIRPAGG